MVSSKISTAASINRITDRGTSSHLIGVIPVLHNLDVTHVPMLAALLHNRPSVSVSLRHPSAAGALAALKKEIQRFNSNCWIGASSVVSEKQIRDLSVIETNFISTMFHAKSILMLAHSLDIPVLCGTQSFEESESALRDQSDALKIFPSSNVTPRKLSDLLAALNSIELLTENNKNIPIIIAGGVTKESLPEYLHYGATGIALGIDCRALSADEIGTMLNRFDLLVNTHSTRIVPRN